MVEKFTITQRTLKVSRGGSYDALEVIGVCRYPSKLYCDKKGSHHAANHPR